MTQRADAAAPVQQKEATMFADARFWDGIAEDYAAKPVQDTAAFERKIAVTKSLLHPVAGPARWPSSWLPLPNKFTVSTSRAR